MEGHELTCPPCQISLTNPISSVSGPARTLRKWKGNTTRKADEGRARGSFAFWKAGGLLGKSFFLSRGKQTMINGREKLKIILNKIG